jgi:hypothetical protein
MEECLLCKQEALGSYPSPRKEGREGGKEGRRAGGRKEGIERYKIRVLPPIMDKINFD